MAHPQRQRTAPLGATFIPGGQDDFYMPTEVVSPAPQRSVMLHVPLSVYRSD